MYTDVLSFKGIHIETDFSDVFSSLPIDCVSDPLKVFLLRCKAKLCDYYVCFVLIFSYW